MTDIRTEAEQVKANGPGERRTARDPVNQPMINNWVEAIGDTNPTYTDVAPPAMIQVWTMGGRATDDPLGAMMHVLDEAGYTSVVATNSDQTYHRYLKVGEQVAVTTELADVRGPKQTALGEGWFVTTRNTWYVGEEPVAEMQFRVLKFKPKQQPSDVIRPTITQDSEYFWEGMRSHELRIQRCGGCGLLRHPPGPMCPECGATKPKYLVASGRGEIYSYVVHHHPQVPGRTTPFTVALVELEEGVRILAELIDAEPEIGKPVVIDYQKIDNDLTLPIWRSA